MLELPCKNEDDLLGNFNTYREHWLSRHPELHTAFQLLTQDHLRSQQLKLDVQFNQILDILLNNLQSPYEKLKVQNLFRKHSCINSVQFSDGKCTGL